MTNAIPRDRRRTARLCRRQACRPTAAEPSKRGLPPIPRMPRVSPHGARRRRRCARATARSPSEPVPARLDLDQAARAPARVVAAIAAAARARRFVDRRRRRLDGARHPRRRPRVGRAITAEALGAHKLYIVEVRHPIEVRAAEQHLMPWLSKRVGTNAAHARPEAYRSSCWAAGCCRGRSVRRRSSCTRARTASASRSTARARRRRARRCAISRRRRRGDALGRERDRLCGQRPQRPRPAREDRADGLRADGKPASRGAASLISRKGS